MKHFLRPTSTSSRKTLGVLALLFALSFNASAQRRIAYRLTTFGVKNAKNLTYTNSPDGGDKVQARNKYVTNPIIATLRKGEFLDFFEEGNPLKNEKGDIIPNISLSVPRNASRDIVVLIQQTKKENVGKLLDLARMKIKPGDQYVYNMSKRNIVFRFDIESKKGKPIPVKKGSSKKIDKPRKKKVIRKAFYSSSGSKYREFQSGLYIVDPLARELIFCYDIEGQKKPRLATIALFNVARALRPKIPRDGTN